MINRKIAKYGYNNCMEISNGIATVMLEPDCGGRIIEYTIGGKDVIYKNRLEDGYLLESGKPPLSNLSPCGGRCDIGPEFLTPPHPVLWLGKWELQEVNEFSAIMTSQHDPVTGVQLRRLVSLSEESSELSFTQYIKNTGNQTRRYFHWSRTFFTGGGIAIVQLNPQSRFPYGYLTYGPGDVINYFPAADPNIIRENGFLQIVGPAAVQKFAFDLQTGWMGYLTKESVFVSKVFEIFPEKQYGEVACNNSSVWYNKNEMCEVEPIGPEMIIEPGQEVNYRETWRLSRMKYSGQVALSSRILNELLTS